ncbi:protein serine/threonine phosphatase [Frankia sp. R43]|uniref:PP2C family protein-serine/threonine phosphatase n=1 Tax=Frankia sp. R43 TaxID=269536 RepID=UPI0006C9F0F8|nr:PP2C family protein-serine/threonine phosphatase [Frankia sp. R43]KPM55842.1 protein serine/threonine phosphatase [Frankia sp. R43]
MDTGGTQPAGPEPSAHPPAVDPAAASPTTEADGRTACDECGATAVDEDGFCRVCGLRAAPLHGPDTWLSDLGAAAGLSDRGRVHIHNEDGMGLELLPPGVHGPRLGGAVGVVCDGVSSAFGSGPAAQAAAAAAAAALARLAAAAMPAPGPEPAGPETVRAVPPRLHQALTTALTDAVQVAQDAVLGVAEEQGLAPACTFVGAIVLDDVLAVGWLGDSRAYLVDGAGARVLTEDDTMAAEAVRAGLLPPELAEQGRAAHTITRWLGNARTSWPPRTRVVGLRPPGRVVLCSDGLWNYASAAATLAAHVDACACGSGSGSGSGTGATPIAVARHLVDVALRAGGADNITVIVIDIPARPG